MNSVAQVNNLAQFVQLVSAARIRNNGLSAGVRTQNNRIAPQTLKSQAFSNAQPLSTYSFSRQPVNSQGAVESSKTNQTRNLGTKFDAYA